MPSLPARGVHSTYAEYLEIEADSPIRHEYLAGEIFAMAGGTPEHAALQVSISGALLRQLAGRPCRVFSSDLRLRVPATGLATYADVTVVYGRVERDAEDENAVVNPTALVEVTSKRTEAYDRGDMFEHYRTIPSLREYVLVSHRESRIDVWRRPPAGGAWTETRAGAGESAGSRRPAAASTWTKSTPPRAYPSRRCARSATLRDSTRAGRPFDEGAALPAPPVQTPRAARSASSSRRTGPASACSSTSRASRRGCAGRSGKSSDTAGSGTPATGGTTRRAAAR